MVFQKTATLFFSHNFGKWRPIFTILSLLDFAGNFLQICCRNFHLTLHMLLHYLAKSENLLKTIPSSSHNFFSQHDRCDRALTGCFRHSLRQIPIARVLFTHAQELDHANNNTMSKERKKRERESFRITQTTKFYIYDKILSCCIGVPPVTLSTRTWLSPRQTTTEFTQQTQSNPDWLLSVLYTKQSLAHARTRVRFRHYQHTTINNCRKIEREKTSYLVQNIRERKDSSNRHDEFWPAVFSTQRDKRQSREPYLQASRTMQRVQQQIQVIFVVVGLLCDCCPVPQIILPLGGKKFPLGGIFTAQLQC